MAAAMEAGTVRDGRRWEVKAVRGDTALLRPAWEAVGLRSTRLTAKVNQPPIRSRMHDGTTSQKQLYSARLPSLSSFVFSFLSTNMSFAMYCTS